MRKGHCAKSRNLTVRCPWVVKRPVKTSDASMSLSTCIFARIACSCLEAASCTSPRLSLRIVGSWPCLLSCFLGCNCQSDVRHQEAKTDFSSDAAPLRCCQRKARKRCQRRAVSVPTCLVGHSAELGMRSSLRTNKARTCQGCCMNGNVSSPRCAIQVTKLSQTGHTWGEEEEAGRHRPLLCQEARIGDALLSPI